MSRLNIRQFKRDVSTDGTAYTSSKPWNLPGTTTIGGETVQSATALPLSERIVYVDASAGAGAGVGTLGDPYRNVKTALETEVTQGGTDDLVFHVAPGVYVGTYTFTSDLGTCAGGFPQRRCPDGANYGRGC